MARRLPAIAIDVAPPPAVQALPRMDVAVFVGFASTGPLHLPVMVESVAQYAAVFGADAPLAWDEQRGERVRSGLGPTVRAFFANGGRRCWVIRVALSQATEAVRVALGGVAAGAPARANRFALPGVLSAPEGQPLQAATAAARCEGSWSDGRRVRSALLGQGFSIDGWGASAPPAADRYVMRTRVALKEGDLLQLGQPDAVVGYARVEQVSGLAQASWPYEVQLRLLAAFERLADATSPAAWPGQASIPCFGEATSAQLAPGADASTLAFDTPLPASIEPGHWARWSDSVQAVWLRIDEIERSPAFVGSPPGMDPSLVIATVRGPAWRELGASLPLPESVPVQATVLMLEVSAGVGTLDNRQRVGLTPAHASSFWALRSDADYYRPRDDVTAPAPVVPDIPRFALVPEAGPVPLAWLPLGAEPVFGAPLAPLPAQGTALERDGLSAFGPALFLDPELEGDGVEVLLAHADDIRLLRQTPRELFGLHAALGIGRGGLFNEASLVALPDAMHLGWLPRTQPPPAEPRPSVPDLPAHWAVHRGGCEGEGQAQAEQAGCPMPGLAAPMLSGPGVPVPTGHYHLAWTCATPGVHFMLVQASHADLSDAFEVYRGPATEQVIAAPAEGVLFHQVFALDGGDRSAGSNVVEVHVLEAPDFGVFLDCDTRLLQAPVLDGPDVPVVPGPYRIAWSGSEPGAVYVLLEATRADFDDAREVFRGPGSEYIALSQREGSYFYQVHAERGDERSAGSNAIVVVLRSDDWALLPPDDDEAREDGWLAVHRALLRLCMATGELFAVLGLPRHFRSAQALRYAARLREVRQPPGSADLQAFGFNEARALTYGALYFPWLQADARGTPNSVEAAVSARPQPQLVPPDGVATGVLAGRASLRGAWIAPANEPIKDVVALSPPVPLAERQALQDAQVNLLRADPRGFLALSADTLALESDAELRPINVRRLMILLRRLALRRGVSYVFEPNGPVLRRAVQRGFDLLLDDLYRRGAFAGATPEQSFRVVTDDTLNTPRVADAGRFIVELHVAPSLPMRFVTVRLAQSGERLSVVEEL